MTPLLANLVEALRSELTQYGEMLALLEHQQALVTRHESGAVLNSIAAVTAHGAALESARARRQSLLRDLAVAVALPDTATFARLAPLLPADYRPLVGALVEENNELLQRVRGCALQNHRLMRHSLDLMHRFIVTLSPPEVSTQPGGEEPTAPTAGAQPCGPSLYAAIV